ncbi:O-methyltransferas-like protein family 3 [Eremomyces bilateralis CBS 781.70]|uniref:O-methyltransferas-like protein family 3 n=1 Tax=Eremomyces bilateralis CBS 781.70 TaxID=1392243 RepID=A0A6G1FUD0_9PEZI|nr:O-methyltransferas-like protein family 3 [Eremomyces bilateralis CBS 781.70]KAF1809316.1 O-methyltransferas-like protein family 3 [Eremomyces bilateralis CBS 781.70]
MSTTNSSVGVPAPAWIAVDKYTEKSLDTSAPPFAPTKSTLDAAHAHAQASGLPDIAVTASQGKFLMLLARAARATNILEVGTLGAFSTIWLSHSAGAGANKADTNVVTVEFDAHHAKIARENLERAGVSDRVSVEVGAGVEVLPRLLEEVKAGKREPFGFVFIDADKQNNWEYFDVAVQLSVPGGTIVVDNVVRRGNLADEELGKQDERIRGSRKVVELAGKDSRVDAVVLQTVGEKGYDGFLLAVVRG